LTVFETEVFGFGDIETVVDEDELHDLRARRIGSNEYVSGMRIAMHPSELEDLGIRGGAR